jgi:hypothetical protein
MARRPNYGFDKRQKEIEKQKRREEKAEKKRQRKEEGEGQPDDGIAWDEAVGDVEVPPVDEDEG